MEKRKSYLKIFLLSFLAFALVIFPIVIYDHGYLTYYGDFNAQQLPFYYHAHQAVKNGNFLWDWGTDLGSDFLTTYSYYLTGSPFFLLSLLLPSKYMLYSVPWLLCLKYSFAALTSYAYIKRFTKKDSSAFIGGFLYAFSGFQAYNIFFNSFHEVTAFFPLLLIAMEENIKKERKGVFALAVALSAIVNYYFFAGQVVFLIIYFILRSRCSDFKVTPKKFFSIAFEAVIGVGIAAVSLVPTALSVFENTRLSNHIYGTDMIAYSEPVRIWRIIQSFFMIPDAPSRPNLFKSEHARWASIAGYLPMFSMIGVISYLRYKPDKWASKLIKICIVCAFIPILNSSFYLFNSEYYARWYYMPVLIMALVTAKVFEDKSISVKAGSGICFAVIFAFILMVFIPVKEDGELKWFSFCKDTGFFFIQAGVTLVFLIAAVILFSRRNKGKTYLKSGFILTIAASVASTAVIFYFGIAAGPYPNEYIKANIEGKTEISNEYSDGFFRTDISENCDNFAMFWDLSSIRCFHSTVSPSIMKFYESVGIHRDVASRQETYLYQLRSFLSVKYYFNETDSNGKELKEMKMPGFKKISEKYGYNIYENEYFVPMGMTFSKSISNERFSELSSASRVALLMRAVVLDEKQMEKYGSLFENIDINPSALLTEKGYIKDCNERLKTCCYDFKNSTSGFSAKIDLDKDNLVLFTVPFNKGFSAYVNGKKAEIENIDNGFMAVYVPAGNNSIEFRYMTYGLIPGAVISLASIAVLFIFVIICLIIKLIKKKYSGRLLAEGSMITPDDTTMKIINSNNENIPDFSDASMENSTASEDSDNIISQSNEPKASENIIPETPENNIQDNLKTFGQETHDTPDTNFENTQTVNENTNTSTIITENALKAEENQFTAKSPDNSKPADETVQNTDENIDMFSIDAILKYAERNAKRSDD